ASNARSQTDDMFNRLGTSNIHVFGGETVLHEIGHHVHLAKLNLDASDEWKKISGNGQDARITAYARTNRGEHFAEAYREYQRGGTHRKRFKTLEPRSYAFMQKITSHPAKWLEPKGIVTQSPELRWQRYTD